MNGSRVVWAIVGVLWITVVTFSGVIYHTVDSRLEKIEVVLGDVAKRVGEATVKRNMQMDSIHNRLDILERRNDSRR